MKMKEAIDEKKEGLKLNLLAVIKRFEEETGYTVMNVQVLVAKKLREEVLRDFVLVLDS